MHNDILFIMNAHIDMVRKKKVVSPDRIKNSEPEEQSIKRDTSASEHRTTSSSNWKYVVLSYIFFIGSVGVGIAVLLHEKEISAAPLVVVSTSSTTPTTEFIYGPQPRLAQSNFFLETLRTFKEGKQSFIEADLSLMKIRYYDLGVVVFEAPILSKGKEGLWWETPAGLYEVQSKEPNHLSSFGGVYQPWSMVFQGNFFIHGWPYYPDGTPVSSQYSGGCIRLADADAEKLYNLSSVHTPVLVYEDQDSVNTDMFSYDVPKPEIDAQEYLIADIQNGTILAEKKAKTVAPIASVTKLMTALIATEYINLDKEVTITERMIASTSVSRLVPGTHMTAYSLLFPLLLESSNEAAITFGMTLGTERFVKLMNEKAKSLGMYDTVFADTSGAHSGNVSTPHDLLRLITYLYTNRSFILKISSGKSVDSAYKAYSFGKLSNFNETPGLTGFVGGKVGKTTAAKETSLLAYEMSIKGTPRTLVFIILGTEDRFDSQRKLYEYIEKQYGS